MVSAELSSMPMEKDLIFLMQTSISFSLSSAMTSSYVLMQSMISLRVGASCVLLVAWTILNNPLQKVMESCLNFRSCCSLLVSSLILVSYLLMSSMSAWWQCASSLRFSNLSSYSTVTVSLPLGLKRNLTLSRSRSFCSYRTFYDSLASSQLSYLKAWLTFSSLISSRTQAFYYISALNVYFSSFWPFQACYNWSTMYSFSFSSIQILCLHSDSCFSSLFLASVKAYTYILEMGCSMEGEKCCLSCWKGVCLLCSIELSSSSSIQSDSYWQRMTDS